MVQDIVAKTGTAFFAEIALVLFVAVFVGVTLKVYLSKDSSYEQAGNIPLDEDRKY